MDYEKNKYKNILIIAITRMGDMLQASPLFMGLKEEQPDCKITVLIDSSFTSICNGIPGIDEVIEIDLAYMCRGLQSEKHGLVDSFAYIHELVDSLRERKFDYCFNMASSAYTALLTKMIGAPCSKGWTSDNQGNRLITSPWSMLFGAYIFHANRDYNSINLVDLVRCSAGVAAHPKNLRFDISDSEVAFAKEFLRQEEVTGSGPLICIQAGASQPKRQWSPERFAALAKLLIDNLDARIVFTGSEEESLIAELITRLYSHSNITTATGKTNLTQLASLLKEADVMITGDTGPMHMSVAVGTPVVALFLASAYAFETGPYSEGNIVIQPQISCSPCNPNFNCARPDCHGQVSPELVAFLAEARLKTPIGQEASIQIPEQLAPGSEVSILYSTFDEHDFLDFKRINGESVKNGLTTRYFETAKAAYRTLWKHEFGPLPEEARPVPVPADVQFSNPYLNGLAQALELAEQGKALVTELFRVIDDTTCPPAMLGQVANSIEQIDKSIETIGLTHPLLGALIRMFVMNKNNIQGTDARLLAVETRDLYESFSLWAKRFGILFEREFENTMRAN